MKVTVILFKPSGKYYTENEWRVPADAIGPYDMERSPDFRRIEGGAVLVETQEPWGYPHLFPGLPDKAKLVTALGSHQPLLLDHPVGILCTCSELFSSDRRLAHRPWEKFWQHVADRVVTR